MKKYLTLLPFAVGLVLSPSSAFSQETTTPSPTKTSYSRKNRINVNNRILARVNGKSISVLDVMKKMDVVFYREFPEYANSDDARYQFYNANWKPIFEEMVDVELIKVDAKEMKIEVSSGDVRQEMEEMFGPNILPNLDKIGVTFEEAWDIVHNDIIIRRMKFAKINMVAMNAVGPKDVIEAYDQILAENPPQKKWKYQFLSIRCANDESGKQIAAIAHDLLEKKQATLSNIREHILSMDDLEVPESISISEEYVHNDREISPSFKETLDQVMPGHFSDPIAQLSRSTGQTVHRIFYLDSIDEVAPPPFDELEPRINDFLVQQKIQEQTVKYLAKLRKKYRIGSSGLDADIPTDYNPFTLN